MNKRRLNLLLIEDDPDDAYLITDMFAMANKDLYEFRVTHANTLEKGLLCLLAKKIDIVLTDLGLPDSQGLSTLKSIRNAAPELPAVVLTGQKDEELGMLAVHLGAQDYQIKHNLQQDNLLRSLIHAVERKRMENELLRKTSEMRVLYELSSIMNHSAGLKELCSQILVAILSLELFSSSGKGALFIIQGENLELVHAQGHSETYIKAHRQFKIGETLCGTVAQTGEIHVSTEIEGESLHLLEDNQCAHGNTVIPLEATNRRVGVLCLDRAADFKVDPGLFEFFRSMGNLIGLSIAHAQLFEETQKLSIKDPLTGLYNRRYMDESLLKNISHAVRFDDALSIILLDIDHFKRYNDSHGHLAGDKALKEIAIILERETRDNDIVARYGGEEFVMILPRTDQTAAENFAERIRTVVEADTGLTVSQGVSTYSTGLTPEAFLDQADQALYQAKEDGRNRALSFQGPSQ